MVLIPSNVPPFVQLLTLMHPKADHELCILVRFVSIVYGGYSFSANQCRSNLSQSGSYDVTWTLLFYSQSKGNPTGKQVRKQSWPLLLQMFGCCKGRERFWLDSGYLQWYSGYAALCSDTNLVSWVNTEQCCTAEHKNGERWKSNSRTKSRCAAETHSVDALLN